MATLHLVPHTHWDREWYLPYQVFRLKLVHLLDLLLEILGRDPAFSSFTLDGQTSVLHDYLGLRPERRLDLERLVRQGRLVIGPWNILPDEFLVSPEALVRNLLAGREDCGSFGAGMLVGYVPDPFGHIGQLPQILTGFGIESAAFRRGLDDQPCELWWQSPDGSRLLTAYLRDGYDNACRLPTAAVAFAAAIADRRDSLTPHCRTSHRLLLNGTDHQEPQAEIPALIAGTWQGPDELRLSTLPEYLAGVRREVESGLDLPVVRGELRSPKRHHLLPGVLSSRTWIKQRNHACETLLESWVEPLTAWADLFAPDRPDSFAFTGHLETPRLRRVQPLVRRAWRMLLECQPHDSICGCSIDAVHDEMRSRFDQVEQMGEELARQALQSLANEVDTASDAPSGAAAALVVFNPTTSRAGDRLQAEFDLPAGLHDFELVDAAGSPIAFRQLARRESILADFDLDREGLRGMLSLVQDGRALGLAVQAVAILPQPGGALVEVLLHENAEPDLALLPRAQEQLARLLDDPDRTRLRLLVRLATRAQVEVLVPSVPMHGLQAIWLRPASAAPQPEASDALPRISNGLLDIEAVEDGTLSLTDRRSGRVYSGLLRFSDRAECGDSYTHTPLAGDAPIESPLEPARIERRRDALGEALHVHLVFALPRGLTRDRSRRSDESERMPIEVVVRLSPGIPRADVRISLENTADDHRLQALFPTGSPISEAWYGGAYEVVSRPTTPAIGGTDWAEQPAREVPLRGFVADRTSDGLIVAARGLREASASPQGVLALTLLRCFGWLSRDDLPNRKGGAGPLLETPGGQEHGRHQFELSLIPFAGDLLGALYQVQAYDTGLRARVTPLHPGPLPSSASLLTLEPDEVQLSAVKAAGDGNGLIVRLVNPAGSATTASVITHLPIRRAERLQLDETPVGPLAVLDGRRVPVALGPHQVVTVRIEPGPTTNQVAPPRGSSWVDSLDPQHGAQQASQDAEAGGRQEDGLEAEVVRLQSAQERAERTRREREAEDQA